MAEINNNIPNFGINNKKVDDKKVKEFVAPQTSNSEVDVEMGRDCLVDNVGNRSLVKTAAKCPDCGKDYDAIIMQTLAFMAENEDFMETCEDMFDELSEQFKLDGYSEEEAYAMAAEAVTTEFAPLLSSKVH